MSYPCQSCGTTVDLHGIYSKEVDGGKDHTEQRCILIITRQRDDARQTIEALINALEDVLSTEPDMPGHTQTLADADQLLDACRRELEEAKKKAKGFTG